MKKHISVRVVSALVAVIMLLVVLYVPSIVSADNPNFNAGDYALIYDYYKNGDDEHYVEGALSDETKASFGISSYGGVLERRTDKSEGVIDTTWNYQYNNGLANSHVVYDVEKGTAFYAEFLPIWAPNLQGYANKKDFVIKLIGWNNETASWEDATTVTVTKDNYDSAKTVYEASLKAEDNIYSKIKILWPSKVDSTYVGDDCLGLSRVALTAPAPDTRVSYEYNNLDKMPLDDSKHMGKSLDMTLAPPALGMYRLSGGSAVSNLNRIGNGTIQPTWTAVWSVNVGEAEFFADYEVMPGTVFTATVNVSNNPGWGKPVWESLECYQGRLFEFKFYTSPDAENWTFAGSTGEKHGQIFMDINVPDDANYVRILYPQDGNPGGKNNNNSKVFNDMAWLEAVKYEPSENSKFGSYFDFNKNGANGLKYDDTNYNYFRFKEYNGVEVFKAENGVAALGASKNYAENGAETQKPFVTYMVKSDSDVKITVTKDAEKCALMGADWDVKFYESEDGENWQEVSETPEISDGGLGKNETYKFKTQANTKYLKVEFPHNGAVEGESGAEIIGIINLGITTDEYEPLEPYGKNIYGEVIDYTNKEVFPTKKNITAAVNSEFSLYDAGISAMYFNLGIGIQASWNYLDKAKNVPKPFVVYNVVEGTPFQTEITFNASAIPSIEDAIGKLYEPKLYVSADNSVWQECCDSSLRLTASPKVSGRAAFILTINKIPEGMKFVKVELPQDNDASLSGGWPYAGNDIIEIATVSLTRGDLPDPNNFTLDESKYGKIIDFKLDGNNVNGIQDISAYAMSWMQNYGLAGPSYSYFESSGENKRAKPNVVVPVEGGKPFFTEIQVRPNIYNSFLEGTYDSKIYISKDGISWEDVTLKYRQRSGAGGDGFGLCERYDFTPDEDVKLIKIEMPNDRNYAGYVTNKDVRLSYIGNDYLGIRKIAFTPRKESTYEHTVNYTTVYNKYADRSIPADITDEVKSVLGFYDYTKDALTMQAYQGIVNGELGTRYVIMLRESYLIGQTKLERPYITYNVKPGTAFEAKMFVNDNIVSYSAPNIMMHVYVSPTGEDGSWTEVKDVFSYKKNNALSLDTEIRFTMENVGENTNFVKIEFPQDGDYGYINPEATQQVGNNFFGIECIKATLVQYSDYFEGREKEEIKFDSFNQNITSTTPIVPDKGTDEEEFEEEYEEDFEEEYDDYEDDYFDDYDYFDDCDSEYEEETEVDENVTVETAKKTKKYKVTKKMLVPDGYTYATWFIVLCISGGVAVIAGIAFLVIVLVKKNKKKKLV